MFRKEKKESVTYGIVGLGRFGMALARELASCGAELVALDRDEEKVRAIREVTESAYVISSLDKKTLEACGLQNCDVAVVCIGEAMDVSILTTLHLKALGVKKVIAKAASADHGLILEKLGAEVVYPERDMGIRLGKRLETARALDVIQLSEKINIFKIRVPAPAVGQSVRQVNIRANFGLNIIAVENGSSFTEVVQPDYIFRGEDVLFLSGSQEGMARLDQWNQA